MKTLAMLTMFVSGSAFAASIVISPVVVQPTAQASPAPLTLAPIIPSNFDKTVWARTTEHPPLRNYPFNFGQLPAGCSFSHFRYDDPIQQYGQFGKAPLAMFFGNTYANANSTYTSLRSAGDGTCFGGPLNRSAFYLPAMMNGLGKVVVPDYIDVIYRGDASTVPFPRGLQMMFGYNAANPDPTPWDESNPRISWSMNTPGGWWAAKDFGGGNGGSNAFITRFQNLVPFSQTLTPPAPAGSNALPSWWWRQENPADPMTYQYDVAGRLVSPPCWNGTQLDSADHRSHMAYKVADASGNMVCPADHPVAVPEVIITVYYDHTGQNDVKNWYLSTDRYGGKNLPAGTNFYAGFIPAWDDEVMNAWVTNILNPLNFGAYGKIDFTPRILEKPPTSRHFAPTANVTPAYFLWSIKTQAPYKGWTGPTSLNNLVDPPPY